jgi:hypothetical protein
LIIVGLLAGVFGLAFFNQASAFSGGAEQVSAVLLEDAVEDCTSRKNVVNCDRFTAAVRYTTLDGETFDGGVEVPKGAAEGARVSVWYAVGDPARVADANPAGDEPIWLAVMIGGLILFATGVAWAGRTLLRRRRAGSSGPHADS